MEYWINALGLDSGQLMPLARAADTLGFAGIAIADHSVMPDAIRSQYPGGAMPWAPDSTWPDVWVQIGALAAVTERLRFVTNVYVLPVRHPLVAARAVGTAAVVSRNRVCLGVGVGWMAEEFEALGQDFKTRGARANEALEILRLALSGSPIEYQGSHYAFARLHLNPLPSQPVPIWVGGESEAALRRAARLGDGWISGASAADAAARLPQLRRELEAAGRADAPFEIAVSAHRPPQPDQLSEWTARGIGHLKVAPWSWWASDDSLDARLAALERFAAEYLSS